MEQHHEAKIHVTLLMTVKQRQPRIRCNKIYFCRAPRPDYDYIFHQSAERNAIKVCDLKAVTVQMHWMIVHTFVLHDQAITLALLQADCVCFGK